MSSFYRSSSEEPPPPRSAALLLRDAEVLASYMSAAASESPASASQSPLKGISWEDAAAATEVLPALRRLLLTNKEERQMISNTIEALLPSSGGPTEGPLSKQSAEVLKAKLWLQGRLFAIHEKAPIQSSYNQ